MMIIDKIIPDRRITGMDAAATDFIEPGKQWLNKNTENKQQITRFMCALTDNIK